jgi:Rrf2 family protein
MLSKTCKYAIRAVAYIAYKGNDSDVAVGVKKIKEDIDIPVSFLSKILQTLVRQSILKSYKGPSGGFVLAKKPKEITLLDIVKIFDGESSFSNCLLEKRDCGASDSTPCFMHEKYHKIKQEWYDMLRNETLAETIKSIEVLGGIQSI